MFESLTPRVAVAVGLLALVPTVIFGVTRSGLGGLIATVNVVLIFAALYVAMSPLEGRQVAAHDTST
ncbi:cytochrome-ba3 oxidase subunit [Haloarchaeobius amylolyticus]|uniref:Cytochrome-ba3 oxidase subunit n=1 Tax=Haloarchaeobius amylolyticus TaxID=1198296 RepID=A0ABD6BH75_9EURY